MKYCQLGLLRARRGPGNQTPARGAGRRRARIAFSYNKTSQPDARDRHAASIETGTREAAGGVGRHQNRASRDQENPAITAETRGAGGTCASPHPPLIRYPALTGSDGQPAPHFQTLEGAERYAAENFHAFTKTTPQWALEENALKHPTLDVETVGGWATTLPEQTLHAWLDQQTKDGAPASNPTADDILAYAPEGSYARHCALIEKAAQDGLNGHLGLEGEYADNKHQLLAYRDGLARAGHEKAAQAIPAPGEWTRPANPEKGGGRERATRRYRR